MVDVRPASEFGYGEGGTPMCLPPIRREDLFFVEERLAGSYCPVVSRPQPRNKIADIHLTINGSSYSYTSAPLDSLSFQTCYSKRRCSSVSDPTP